MQHKNNYYKKFIIKIFMLFIFFISFGVLIFFINQKSSLKTNSHIAINFPQGYNDRGFNQSIIEGVCLGEGLTLEECDREKEKFNKKITYAFSGTSVNPEKFFEHINYYRKTYKTKNFVIPGFTATEFFVKYLTHYQEKDSDVKFVGVDSYYGPKKNEEWVSNFWQVNFLHWFSGYHAGIYAAAWAAENHTKLKDADLIKKGKQIYFSSIGGMSIPAILKYAIGFKLGINIFNKKYQEQTEKEDIEFIHSEYDTVQSFDSSDLSVKKKAKALTENQFSRGSSIVFMIATSLVFYAIEAAIEQDQKTDSEHFIIGVDVDARKQVSDVMKNKVITSAIIDFTKIIKEVYETELNIEEEKGKDLLFGGHLKATITPINKSSSIWIKNFGDEGKFKTIKNLGNLPFDILGSDKQIALITTKQDKSKLASSNKGIIYKYIEYLDKEKKLSDTEEYKRILRSSNPLEYIRSHQPSQNND